MISPKELYHSLLQLVFPHVCAGCGSDLLSESSQLCMRCMTSMPRTNYENFVANPVETMFYGRLPLVHASACFYFTKESLMQRLMHQLKYKGNKDLGLQLGLLMGMAIKDGNRMNDIDALIPLPLFASKEKKRGYNQAAVLCMGMAEALSIPVLTTAVVRTEHTDSQTKKGRIDRWKNIEGKFELVNPAILQNKHVLLVDDVITTGATMEACGAELLQAAYLRLSIATLCQASRI